MNKGDYSVKRKLKGEREEGHRSQTASEPMKIAKKKKGRINF